MAQKPYCNLDFVQFMPCRPFDVMLFFLVIEAALADAITSLIIKAGHDVADQEFLISDFVWIVPARSASYLVGATSWIFAERAGFGAYGLYLLRFARDNRHQLALLADKTQREQGEPFLTNETSQIFFELLYKLEADLKLFFGLIFNAIVLAYAIDAGLSAVFAGCLWFCWRCNTSCAARWLAAIWRSSAQTTDDGLTPTRPGTTSPLATATTTGYDMRASSCVM